VHRIERRGELRLHEVLELRALRRAGHVLTRHPAVALAADAERGLGGGELSDLVGGIEVQLHDLAGRLAAAGHEVHVVTTTPADPRAQRRLQSAPLEAHPAVRVHRLDVPLVPGLGVTFSPGASSAARRILEEERVEVAHVHASIGSTMALAGAHAARAAGVPQVVTFHSVIGGYAWVLRVFDRAFGWSRWPQAVSAVSSPVARELEALVPQRPVHVLPNGVDTAAWRVEPRRGEPGVLRLVSVLRLQRRKRARALLHVVALAAARLAPDMEVRLTVIGDGPQRGRLEAEARRLGLGERVRFTGYLPRDAIRERFAEADAFVLVSVLESFGLSAAEARAAGLPVVARGDSGMGELFVQGRGALLAPSDEGVADHLVRLGRDRDLLGRLREHNRTPAPSHDWGAVLERHLELYRAVREGGEAARRATGF
ncbi:MAG: glycosyltransferase, partial [Gemmatimonadetes bacterium]|nr:glycosyltransferase [Gemmatimonadota bacterium]